MNLKETLNWRYSTKEFDATKKIPENELEQIKALLQKSPSSTNLQPWHFIIASSEEGKKRMAKGTQGSFSFNEAKILNASHVVLFCSRTTADEGYMQHLLNKEELDGRFPNDEVKRRMNDGRNSFANIHKFEVNDLQHWLEKQVYLNLGQFLLGVASLGIDAVPMEGIDIKLLNEEFYLTKKGFTAVAVVALGYRKEGDFNIPSKTPKSRLPLEEILSII